VFFRENLLNPHWGNNVHINSDDTCEISLICQGLDETRIHQAWQPFVDWVKARPGEPTVTSLLPSVTWNARRSWEAIGPAWIKDPRAGAPAHHAWNVGDQDECGAFIHGYESLWLPASLLEEDRKHLLTDALFAASRHKSLQLHISKGLAGATPDVRAAARDTPTNPAVLDACALVIIADGEAPAYPGLERPAMDLSAARRDARAIDLATEELRKVIPHAGSYVAESNYFNDSWQTAYWGNHYSRLRAIKRKYDPDGLFFVHHGVGSEDWSADGFTRLT
jgi:FAD/FMN-containing dehydrogenase